MPDLVPDGTAGGNTITPAVKRESCKKRYCFTLNNYNNDDLVLMVNHFKINEDKYIIGEEIGEQGTPHLQGYVEFNKRKRLSQLKIINNKCHWEIAKGNKNDNIKYCSKDNKYHTNFKIPRKFIWPSETEWYPWQKEILKIISTIPDNRTIYWYWSAEGKTGKTTFTNYLAVTHNAILCPSKTNDAFHRIAKAFDENEAIDLVVFDVPRCSIEFINYSVIEKIKDGQVVSGKYEGAQCVFPSPHVIIFANEQPSYSQLSSDRWVVTNIGRSLGELLASDNSDSD